MQAWVKEKEYSKQIYRTENMRLLEAVTWLKNIQKNYFVGGREMIGSVLNRFGLRRWWHIQEMELKDQDWSVGQDCTHRYEIQSNRCDHSSSY